MAEVQFQKDEKGMGNFSIMEEEKQLGELVIEIKGNKLNALHTEVVPEAEGKGLAKELFLAMVAYARKEKLTVNPLCTYVHLQLKRNADEYADIWKPSNAGSSHTSDS